MCLSYRELKGRDVLVRQSHMCAWCAERIEQGSTAHYRVYVFDSELTRDWMHPECFTAMSNSDQEYVCEGWMAGDYDRGIAAKNIDRILYA